MPRVVLAYNGGVETSAAIAWLAERYDEVVTVTLDLGQRRELIDVRHRALAAGAVRAHVLDAREEFASSYILPALQAGAVLEERDPLGAALAGALIAKRLVDVARMESAGAVAHGCSDQGSDQVSLDRPLRALAPPLDVIAPVQMWPMSPSDAIACGQARDVPAAAGEPYNIHASLWSRSIEYPMLENSWREPPEDVFTLTRAPQDGPDEPASVEIAFEEGVPVRVNGVDMPLVELIDSLATIGGAHGVGRFDTVASRPDGVKVRRVHEAPAALLLHAAHAEIEHLVFPSDLVRIKRDLARACSRLILEGQTFSPARRAIDAFAASIQPQMTGVARLRLFTGDCRVVGREAPAYVGAGS